MDRLRDGIAMHGFALQSVQDEKIERSLQQVLAFSHPVDRSYDDLWRYGAEFLRMSILTYSNRGKRNWSYAAKVASLPFVGKFTHLTEIADLRSTHLRLKIMGRLTTQEKAEFQNLNAAYREAWARLLLQVSYWQSLNADRNAGSVAVAKAWDAVERAEAGYRQSRNRLAEYLLPSALLAKQLVKC